MRPLRIALLACCQLALSMRIHMNPPEACLDPSSSTFQMPSVPVDKARIVDRSTEAMLAALKAGATSVTEDILAKLLGPMWWVKKAIARSVEAYSEALQEDANLEDQWQEDIQKGFEAIVPTLGRMVKAERVQAEAKQLVQDHGVMLDTVARIMRHYNLSEANQEDKSQTYARLVSVYDSLMGKRATWIVSEDDGERAFALWAPSVEMAGLHMAVTAGIVAVAGKFDRGRWLSSSYELAGKYASSLQDMAITAVKWRASQYLPADGPLYEEFCASNENGKHLDEALVVRHVLPCFLRDNYLCTKEDGIAYGERASACSTIRPNSWIKSRTIGSHKMPKSCQYDDFDDWRLFFTIATQETASTRRLRRETHGYDRAVIAAARSAHKIKDHVIATAPNNTLDDYLAPPNLRTLRTTVKEDIEIKLWKEFHRISGSSWLAFVKSVGCDIEIPNLSMPWTYFKSKAISSCLKDRSARSRIHVVSLALQAVDTAARFQAQLSWEHNESSNLQDATLIEEMLLPGGRTTVITFPLTEGVVPRKCHLVVHSGLVSIVEVRIDDAIESKAGTSSLGAGTYEVQLPALVN